MNEIGKTLSILRRDGWKSLGWGMGRHDHNAPRCLLNAYDQARYELGLRPVNVYGGRTRGLIMIKSVIRELYPGTSRVNIPDFNDDVVQKFEEIEVILEKASIKFDEKYGG